MGTQEISVHGMTCQHCVDAVTHELMVLPGVDSVSVDLASDGDSTVTVTADPMPSAMDLAAAVEAAGYAVADS